MPGTWQRSAARQVSSSAGIDAVAQANPATALHDPGDAKPLAIAMPAPVRSHETSPISICVGRMIGIAANMVRCASELNSGQEQRRVWTAQ